MNTLMIRLSSGEINRVTSDGRITRLNMNGTGGTWPGSPQWVFLGFSFHPFRNGIDLALAEVLASPERLAQARKDSAGRNRPLYGWDRDHGTLRRWGSPGIVSAYVQQEGSAA